MRLAGEAIRGWFSAETDSNSFRSADTFNVTFAVSDLPFDRNETWFSQQKSVECEIFATADAGDADPWRPLSDDRLILGAVDDITFDPVARTLAISGRDLTAKLIDTKTSEHFANKTASEIASILAARHGLTPVVQATKTKVGELYKDNHTDLTQEQSEWELLSRLADVEDYRVYVTGRELHFEPRDTSNAPIYDIIWQAPGNEHAFPVSNTVGLRFTRSLTIVKGLKVEIRTWNAKHKRAYTVGWPRASVAQKPGSTGPSKADETVYRYTIAGLTPDEAIKRAKSIYEQIAANAMEVTADLPGDGVITIGSGLRVSGTGTAWDQTYFPTSIKRSMSVDEGYRMTITAKNLSPELEQNG